MLFRSGGTRTIWELVPFPAQALASYKSWPEDRKRHKTENRIKSPLLPLLPPAPKLIVQRVDSCYYRAMNADELQLALEKTFVIIPMLNEENSIGHVLNDLPKVRRVLVVDNGSTDRSPQRAQEAGACVLHEPQRGYGKACLKGIAGIDSELQAMEPSDGLTDQDAIVVFIDGDYSDHPDELTKLLHPIVRGDADFVIGSRTLGTREPGAMHIQAILGNWLACRLMRLFWNAEFTDLGPFRAIRYLSLKKLQMQDENFGWTIEMQIKAVQAGLRCTEVPVSYRQRIGASKISGTIWGTLRAGYKILYTIFRYSWMYQRFG